MNKFFLYARKSTDEPDRQILSIESQIDELKEFAEREQLEIVETFVFELQNSPTLLSIRHQKYTSVVWSFAKVILSFNNFFYLST